MSSNDFATLMVLGFVLVLFFVGFLILVLRFIKAVKTPVIDAMKRRIVRQHVEALELAVREKAALEALNKP